MAPLRLPRREKFAQEIAKSPRTGKSITQCYEASGYTTTGHASEAAGSRLLSEVEIKNRIDEIVRPTVRKTRATVDTLAAQLDAVFEGASSDRQWGAAGSAAALKAKLLGFMRERLEVGGPGEFERDCSLEQVAEDMVNRLGGGDPAAALVAFDAMSANLRSIIEARAAAAATTVFANTVPTHLDEDGKPLISMD